MAGITHGLEIHVHAQAQLREIFKTNPTAGGEIAAFLSELKGCQRLLDRLLEPDFEDERFSVTPVVELQKQLWNCWRITLFKITEESREKLPYRIIYAFDYVTRVFHVLAIDIRSSAYTSDAIARDARHCEGLGIKRLPRA